MPGSAVIWVLLIVVLFRFLDRRRSAGAVVRPGLRGRQQVVEPFVAFVPEPLVAGQPGGHLAQRLGLQAAEPRGRPPGARDQARLLEHLQVLGDRRLGHDGTDGLNFYNEYGMLRELFADPALAADKRYADVLRGYLRAETIGPLPLRRLAAAYPDTVDAVYRKILRKRDFTWAEHGEALMRRRKAWYYQHEPRPGVSVIGARLLELASSGRR